MSERRLPPRLVALTPGDLDALQVARFGTVIEAAIAAGLRGILVREPALSDRVFLELALEIAGQLPPDGYLAIHDRVHLAPAATARAVHLGFRSLTPSDARKILPHDVAIGLSAHAHDAPEDWRGADYLFFGPVLDTPSKQGLLSPVGFEGLARATAQSPVPVFAIGGLTPEHAAPVRRAGAHGIAVLRGVLGSPDPAASVRAYVRALDSAG